MYQINYYPTFSVLIFTFISSTNINDLMCIPWLQVPRPYAKC